MLTGKAAAERKWGWLPALRPILESERVPEEYFGASSVSDNIFDQLHRLIEIDILVHENRAKIVEALRSESRQQIEQDLRTLQGALRQAQKMLQASEERVRSIAS